MVFGLYAGIVIKQHKLTIINLINMNYVFYLQSLLYLCILAVFASLRSIVIMNIVGEAKFNVAFGLSLLFMGVATLFSNTLGGN